MSPSKVTHPSPVQTVPPMPASSSATAVPNTSTSNNVPQIENGSHFSEQTVSNPKSNEDVGKEGGIPHHSVPVANGSSDIHSNGIGMGPAVKRESDQNDRDGEETGHVLSGVVIAISKKLNSQDSELDMG